MATQRTSTQLKNYFLEHDPQEWVEDLLESIPTLDEAWTQGSAIVMEDSQSIHFGSDRDASLTHDGSTGLQVQLADNDADALDITESTNPYMVFNTLNSGGERIELSKPLVSRAAGSADIGSTSNEMGKVYLADSKGVYFGSDQDASLLHDGSTGVELSVADNDADAFEIKQGASSYVAVDTTNNVERIDFNVPLDMQLGQDHSTFWECFDDFNYQAVAETYTPWILNTGGSAPTVDPAIASGAYGVITLTCGTHSGAVAADGSQLVGAIPVKAEDGNLVFETRLHIDSAITEVAINAGLTDATTLEEPFTIAAGTVTANASDGACFVYDSAATTKGWYGCAVDSTTADTGNGTLAIAPTAGTYQTLRLEVNTTGGSMWFFVNGALKRTLTSEGVSPDVSLYPTVIACSAGSATKTVDVDYVYYGCTRGAHD